MYKNRNNEPEASPTTVGRSESFYSRPAVESPLYPFGFCCRAEVGSIQVNVTTLCGTARKLEVYEQAVNLLFIKMKRTGQVSAVEGQILGYVGKRYVAPAPKNTNAEMECHAEHVIGRLQQY
jgi:hypothetical protein